MFGQVMDSNVLPDKNGSKTQGVDRAVIFSLCVSENWGEVEVVW